MSRREKFLDLIKALPEFGEALAYKEDCKKLYHLIWYRDDLTEAFEYQDELNEKWAGKYPALREL